MTAKLSQYQFIEAPTPPPPPVPQVCERIATNQRGEEAFFYTPLAISQTWEGQSSTETGVHQQYEIEAGGDPTQQYIVMKSVSGNFTAGEILAEA